MFDNKTIEVCIGLFLVYLLYSLLATTINEIISSLLVRRPRMLERGIEQMLDGKNYTYNWIDQFGNSLYYLFYLFSGRNKAPDPGTFNNNLIIKSYKINYFFTTKKINAISPSEKKFNKKKKAYFKRFVLNKKAELFAHKVINHPLYRRASENSLLVKKPAYLNADIFSDIMIDLLSNQNGEPALLKDISTNIKTNKSINKDLKNILLIYSSQANGDLQRFRSLLEIWYNQTMDRVSGWYKRQSNRSLLWIGLIMAFMFNLNTIEIIQKLSTEDIIRKTIADNSQDYLTENKIPINELKPDNSLFKSVSMLSLGWEFEDCKKCSFFKKVIFAGKLIQKKPDSIIGFLITALAISLGAPFWYDLLNKFINIRIAGKKPDDKTTQQGESKTNKLNQLPDPEAFG